MYRDSPVFKNVYNYMLNAIAFRLDEMQMFKNLNAGKF